jgi:20S proteasome alpha/beta subunit
VTTILDFPETEMDTDTYVCLPKPPILTVVIGAKCSNGIVLIADTKFTDMTGGNTEHGRKIFGDLAHFLVAYSGTEYAFDIFRKYIVGDVLIPEDDKELKRLHYTKKPYTDKNIVANASSLVKHFNNVIKNPGFAFGMLVAIHNYDNSRLHFIDTNGDAFNRTYQAIGSGQDCADMFCSLLNHEEITMIDFTKRAYVAIEYMNQCRPDLFVGLEPNGTPMIRFLDYKEKWDEEPQPDQMKEFKEFATNKMTEFDKSLKSMINNL